MKIGILGGTFDPVHNGHMFMAQTAFCSLSLDKIIFIPSGQVPHKNNSHITDSADRYNMVCCAIKNYENYTVSDTEINRDGVCYTFETLRELSCQYMNDELHFIIGADSVCAIDSWKNPGEIFKYAALAVVGRRIDACFNIYDVCRGVAEKYSGIVNVVSETSPDISSTEIRRRLKDGESVIDLVPDCVIDYIKNNKLYERQ